MADGRTVDAYEHARDIMSIERGLHIFAEPSVQAWASSKSWIIDSASWMYVNSHFTLTVVLALSSTCAATESFYFMRNMFCIAMGIALVGYFVFPTAPPRFFPEWGFHDSVAAVHRPRADNGSVYGSSTRSPRFPRCTSPSR